MPLIIWREAYLIGFNDIDAQHQKLVELINMLFDSISQKDQTKVLNEAFNDLIHYANYHFSREEELMEKYGYSEYLTHKEEHNYFIDKITELKKEFREGDSKVMLHVINFLKDWLLKHIMGTDRNYIQTLKSKGYK